MNLQKTLQRAVKEVPILRYAYGVIGLVAVIVLIKNINSDPRLIVLGSLGVIFGMIVFILLEKAATSARLPAKVFLWFSLILMMSTITVIVSSAIFNKPDLGIYESLFKREVNTLLERIADKKVAEALQRLPPEGVDLIMDAGDKRMRLVSKTPDGNYIFRSADEYPVLKQMAAANLAELEVPPAQFDLAFSKLRLAPERREDYQFFIADPPLISDDERLLLKQSYKLSKEGLKVYEAIIAVAKEQLK